MRPPSSSQRAAARPLVVCRSVVFRRDELTQAVMVLSTGRTTLKVCTHARDGGISIASGDLQVDVAVEVLKAFFAGDLRSSRAQQSIPQIDERAMAWGTHGVPPSHR